MTPVDESACKMPTIAEELCTMTVKTSPVKIPMTGILLKGRSANFCEFSESGSTALVIAIRPDEQDAEAHKDHADVFRIALFNEHDEDDTGNQRQRRPGSRA